jgi:uncharacterized protein (TIGR00730 family)
MSDSTPGPRPLIGVLGSGRIEPGDARHAAAVTLGGALARAGYDVATGGYGGLMGAVSQGAADAGGRVVGLTMRAWSELRANRWVTDEIVAEDWFDRLRRLAACDVLVALEGGLGTLAELSTAWANAQTDPETNPPLVLVGPAWAELAAAIERLLVVDGRDIALVRLVSTVNEVPAAIAELLASRTGPGRRYG